MLTIRKEQVTALQKVFDQELSRDVESYVRGHHAAAVAKISAEGLQDMISSGITRCKQLGLTYVASVCWFVAMMLEVAPHFDTHPRIRARLEDQSVPPEMRIQTLLERTTPEDWEETRKYT